jgi:hypothetical protein
MNWCEMVGFVVGFVVDEVRILAERAVGVVIR